MSKESSVPLTRTLMPGTVDEITVDERWRRYPVTDRKAREALGLSEDGHRVPPPSARRKRK